MSNSIPDPNDFADDTPTGTDPGVGDEDAGQPGTGGLSEQQAEESFERANEEHFRDDTTPGDNDQNTQKPTQTQPAHIPQVGSTDDIKKNEGHPVSEDPLGEVTTDIDEE